MEAPQRKRIPGATDALAVEVAKAELYGSAVYHIAQGESLVVLSHQQTQLVAAELMDAWDEEERRQASL